jgi:2-keto-4-pentenoate hydratase/2-oxohepta-3-ene-1,7-dioic acid hydratase in catechol pathway
MPTFGFASAVLDGVPTLAALSDLTLYPLDRLLAKAPATFADVLADWDGVVDAVDAALDDATLEAGGVPAEGVRFLVPGVSSPAVWCAGANYTDHVKEMGATEIVERAFHFLTPPTGLAGPGCDVRRPAGILKLDWEVELVAVIGRTAKDVDAADALDHVAGYTVGNDVSVRDHSAVHPVFGVDWAVAKNADGHTVVGPAIVPARYVADPGDLGLSLTVNGEIRQDSRTSRMILDLARQIEALSRKVSLRPGDLLFTGTPAGTAAGHGERYLADGDVMVARVEGLGELRSTVV